MITADSQGRAIAEEEGLIRVNDRPGRVVRVSRATFCTT